MKSPMYRRGLAGLLNASLAVTLYFTVPGSGKTASDCIGGGPALHGIRAAYLWGQGMGGGGFAVVDSHSVVGKEGQPDSFQVNATGSYFVTTRNNIGTSCAPGSPVSVVVGDPTGVPVTAQSAADPVVRWALFSPLGAKVKEFRASGIYFARIERRSGHVEQRKIPFVRGIGPLVQVRDFYQAKLSH
jgi:hypothetical protein